jgi:hypothetical protein
MKSKKTIRDRVSEQFGFPIGRTSFRLYFAMLNEQGKITPRSLLDLFETVLEYLDEAETK